jgi:hypothetical protein
MANVVLAQQGSTSANPFLCADSLLLGANAGGTSMSASGNSFFKADVRVSNQVFTKGVAVSYNPFDPDGPSSSYNTFAPFFNFQLGQNHTWGLTAIPGTYGWSSSAGTPGVSKISVAAADPAATIIVSRKAAVGVPAGVLTVIARTATDFDVASLDAAGAVLATDTAEFDWVVLNPVWP